MEKELEDALKDYANAMNEHNRNRSAEVTVKKALELSRKKVLDARWQLRALESDIMEAQLF